MKRKSKLRPVRKKKLKSKNETQNSKSTIKYPKCCRGSTGLKILEKLSKVYGLKLKIWKHNQLIQTFGLTSSAKKINVEFRPKPDSEFGEWFLKNKRSKTSGKCVYQLVAEKINSNPHYLQQTLKNDLQSFQVDYYIGVDERAAKGWLDRSQTGLDINGKRMGQPRASCSFYERTGPLNVDACIQYYSLYLAEDVERPGFLSYQQQDYFAHLLLKSAKGLNMLNYLFRSENVVELKDDFSFLDIGFSDPVRAGLFGGLWVNGRRLKFEVASQKGPFRTLFRMTGLHIVLKKFRTTSQQPEIMISEFYPHLEKMPRQKLKKVLTFAPFNDRIIKQLSSYQLHEQLKLVGFDDEDFQTYHADLYDEEHARALLDFNGSEVCRI